MSAMKPAPRMATLVGATSASTGRAEALPHDSRLHTPGGDRAIERGQGDVAVQAIDGRIEVRLDVHFKSVVHVHVEGGVILLEVERDLSSAIGVLIAPRRHAVCN